MTAVADTVDVDLVAAGVATLLAAIGSEPFVSATVGGVTRFRRGHRRDGERWWAVSVSWNDSRRWRFVTRSEATAVASALDRLA